MVDSIGSVAGKSGSLSAGEQAQAKKLKTGAAKNAAAAGVRPSSSEARKAEPKDVNDARQPQSAGVNPAISSQVINELEAEGAYALAASVRDMLGATDQPIANDNPQALQSLFA